MKRFFIAALALVAVVGCSKDDEAPILENSKKSIAITIQNQQAGGRAVTSPAPITNAACTKAEDLVFGFCDGAGNVLAKLTLANANVSGNVYTFHGMPQQVSEVFVIANGGANKITTANCPTTLSAAHQLWEAPAPEAEWQDIIAFGHSAVKHVKEDGEEVFCETEINGKTHKFPLFEASVRVAPNHARLEIGKIQCQDLGTKFSKLELQEMVLGATTTGLRHSFGANGLALTADANAVTAGEGKVWSFNVTKPANADVTRPDLTLFAKVTGKDWTVPEGTEVRTVTVVDYKATDSYTNRINVNEQGNLKHFVPGEIYTMDLVFKETNVYTDHEYLCVNVNVTIADWIVVPVTPVF